MTINELYYYYTIYSCTHLLIKRKKVVLPRIYVIHSFTTYIKTFFFLLQYGTIEILLQMCLRKTQTRIFKPPTLITRIIPYQGTTWGEGRKEKKKHWHIKFHLVHRMLSARRRVESRPYGNISIAIYQVA